MNATPIAEFTGHGPDELITACQTRLRTLDPHQALRRDPIAWHAVQRLWSEAEHATGPLRQAILRRLAHHLEGLAQKLDLADSDRSDGPVVRGAEPQKGLSWAALASPLGTPLASLAPMRQIHARLKVRQQVRHALAQPLHHAGPLHSERLVQQSLARMDAWSEAYLHRFMSYVEALAALEDDLSLVRVASAASAPKPRAKIKGGSTTKR